MIVEAWDEYRGWAKRARSLQRSAEFWNFWSLVAFVATGLLGAAAAYFAAGGAGGALDDRGARALACVAAVAAAVSLYVGRQALAYGAEAGWLRARAIAESIKSECFRFAAGVHPYEAVGDAPKEALALFIERRGALAGRAGGDLTAEDDPVTDKGDDRRPERPLSDAWYIEKRIDGQIHYYASGREKNEKAYARLRDWGFAVGIVTTVVSTAAAYYGPQLAVWVAVLTTFGAAISAYGLADRQRYLASTYAGMKGGLERIKERYRAGGMSLPELVGAAEDLMESEHSAWIERMTRTVPAQPDGKPEPDKNTNG